MTKTKQWQSFPPKFVGKYRVRDNVFGWKIFVRVYIHPLNDELMVRPEAEPSAHGVAVIATPTWWEWREA